MRALCVLLESNYFTVLADNTKIEFASVSDSVEISEISRTDIEYNLRAIYTPIRIRHLVQNTSSNVVVARKADELIGFGIMTYKENSANLDLLAVKKQFRRQSIGTQVVQWLEKVASTAGIMNIFVQVRKNNITATQFYESLQFHIIDEAEGYYEGRETCVIMCKGIREMIGRV